MSRAKRKGKSSRQATPAQVVVAGVTLSAQGMRSSDLCELAEDRIKEAIVLMANQHYTGAAYIVGYAVELYFKAIIARQQCGGFWPLQNVAFEYRTHNLEGLLTVCGLRSRMRTATTMNPELAMNWQILRDWGPDLRYRRLRRPLARDIVNAVSHSSDGVAQWLRSVHEGG